MLDLFEVVAELDQRDITKHAFGVHGKFAMVQSVQVRCDEEEIRGRLYRKEPASGDVDAVCILKMLDGGSNGGFKLQYLFSRFQRLINESVEVPSRLAVGTYLLVHNDFKVKLTILNDTLDGLEINP